MKIQILSVPYDTGHCNERMGKGPEIATASHLAPPGGLALEELETALSQIAAKFTIRSGALTAYDPEYDRDGRALDACKRIAAALAAAAQAS